MAVERMTSDLNLIEEWIRSELHLPQNYDERILRPFLRGCKNNVARTKKKLDMYFSCRNLYPEIFGNRDTTSEKIHQAFHSFNVFPLPKMTQDNLKLVLHVYNGSDASEFDTREVFKMIYIIADIRLIEEPPINGDIFLFDVQKMTTGHFAKLLSPIVKCALHCAQDAYPQRLKAIHLFNAPPLIDKVVNFFKPFLKEKMRNRFFIHTSLDTLYEHVPRSHLPADYGGELEKISHFQSVWMKKLECYKEYFEEQEACKTDESKRDNGGPMRVSETNFGIEGAFRQLQID